MNQLPRVFLLLSAILCAGCGHDRAREFEGRWEVRMRLTETWEKRLTPLTDSIAGEIIFSPEMPSALPWNPLGEDVPPFDAGCAFIPEERFAGQPAIPARSAIEVAERCDGTVGYRSGDTVHIVMHAGYIDAETWMQGFRLGDTIRGGWESGSRALDQGGRGTFVMWKLHGEPHPNFYALQRASQRERRRAEVLGALDWFFALRLDRARPSLAVVATGAALLLAVVWMGFAGWRRRSAAMLIIMATGAAEWLVYRDGLRTIQRAWRFGEFVTVDWGPVLILTGTMLMILILAGLAVAQTRRSALLDS